MLFLVLLGITRELVYIVEGILVEYLIFSYCFRYKEFFWLLFRVMGLYISRRGVCFEEVRFREEVFRVLEVGFRSLAREFRIFGCGLEGEV